MTPSINVNLAVCVCPHGTMGRDRADYCPCRQPVHIPCAILRSVTFSVALGECVDCEPIGIEAWRHMATCPAQPIRVSCSISGATWKESEVSDVEERGAINAFQMVPETRHTAALAACRTRWALVKALVLGEDPRHDATAKALHTVYWKHGLFERRDAVFAALATLARTEANYAEAYSEAWATLGRVKACNSEGLTSTTILGDYIQQLVEQIGAMT